MLTLRKSQDRGYDDPAHMGWGNLRVINEDRIAPGTGFGTHGHRDMEIISYVLSGELAHKDSMGNVKGIPPGDIQRMSAGTGVMHSEFNHAPAQETHFFQIWIEPQVGGIAPSYEQKTVSTTSKRGRLVCVASPEGQGEAVKIHADARLYAGLFTAGETATLDLKPERRAYVHLIRGTLSVNGQALQAGDAALMTQVSLLTLSEAADAEVLVFDLRA